MEPKERKELVDELTELDRQLEEGAEAIYSIAKPLYFEGSEDEAASELRAAYGSAMKALMALDKAIHILSAK